MAALQSLLCGALVLVRRLESVPHAHAPAEGAVPFVADLLPGLCRAVQLPPLLPLAAALIAAALRHVPSVDGERWRSLTQHNTLAFVFQPSRLSHPVPAQCALQLALAVGLRAGGAELLIRQRVLPALCSVLALRSAVATERQEWHGVWCSALLLVCNVLTSQLSSTLVEEQASRARACGDAADAPGRCLSS